MAVRNEASLDCRALSSPTFSLCYLSVYLFSHSLPLFSDQTQEGAEHSLASDSPVTRRILRKTKKFKKRKKKGTFFPGSVDRLKKEARDFKKKNKITNRSTCFYGNVCWFPNRLLGHCNRSSFIRE